MHFLPFLVLLIAAVLFAVDWFRTRSLIAGGLTLLTSGLVLHFIIRATENVVTWTW